MLYQGCEGEPRSGNGQRMTDTNLEMANQRAQKTVKGLRILLVDDEPVVREPIAMLLNLDSHEVTEASSGGQALELLDAASFDLLITDYRMEGMTGDELAVKAKKSHPDLPVLMLTGFIPSTGGSNPVDGIVYKPCSLDDLRNAIAKVVRR